MAGKKNSKNRGVEVKLDKKGLACAAAVLGLVITVCFAGSRKEKVSKIVRPGYGENEENHSFIVEYDGEEKQVDIKVNPVELPLEQLDAAFEETFEEVCRVMCGENSSLDEVVTNLKFENRVGKYAMNVEYFSENYDLINSFGEVNNEGISDNCKCVIKVNIYYKEMYREYEVPVLVIAQPLSNDRILENDISAEINKQTDNKLIELPDELEGKSIIFYQEKTGLWAYVFLLFIAIGAIVYNTKIYKPKKQKEEREKQMISDYSEIVSKLSLLMGTGMSAYNALSRIATDNGYGNMSHYAYKEILHCVNRISSGVAEQTAYMEFRRKCGLMPYIRLSNLLIQNINMGTKNIFELLREETISAFNERKHKAKKTGEEAGTKLLLPMSMMLIVVLVIIVVPSLFMSF